MARFYVARLFEVHAELPLWRAHRARHQPLAGPGQSRDRLRTRHPILNLGGRQASWHIAPRDADLFTDIEHVTVDDPRAQWDGHTTDVKYEALRTLTAGLLENGSASKPSM